MPNWWRWPATCSRPRPFDRPRDAGLVLARLGAHLSGVQERLRAAELARAAESARAEEAKRTAEAAEARARSERRARRLTMALAASILGFATVGGLGASAYLQERQAPDLGCVATHGRGRDAPGPGDRQPRRGGPMA